MKESRNRPPPRGCDRCRRIGAIDLLLCRQDHPPHEMAARCVCPASDNFRGLPHVDRFIEGWSRLGASVVEWPTAKQRMAV